MKKNIAAIIVLYNPNLDCLKKLVLALLNSCDEIILVDNTPCKSINYDELWSKVHYFHLRNNEGIAYAQNYGFMKATAMGGDIFFTFDQDSMVDDSFIDNMVDVYNESKTLVKNIGALGPLVINSRDGSGYNRDIAKGKRIVKGVYEVDVIISSGAMFTLEALTYIGLNKSEWFIDLIDFEWCYRAKKCGWAILSTDKAKLSHNLGQNDMLFLGCKVVSICSPFRLYYVFRNCILALKESSFPFGFKCKMVFVLPVKLFIHMCADKRYERLKYIFKGIRDGLLGTTGRYLG